MKENLYSGGYWQYFHDISHIKLHPVPCAKYDYVTYIKIIIFTVTNNDVVSMSLDLIKSMFCVIKFILLL